MLGVKTAALPASLRRTNQRTVISLLLRLGSASRADLAKAAGISQPTAGKITSELLHLGILQETGSASENGLSLPGGSPRLGRPGQMLRLDDRRPRFIAIELGVSETCFSALPVAIKLEDDWRASFPTPKTPEAWLAALKDAAAGLRGNQFWGVLVSVPGIVDEAQRSVLFSPNLHWLEKVSLPRLLEEIWDIPVVLVQEIRALALGHLTANPGGEDFFLVDFGQGVGGAVVLGGKLYPHPRPLSGEFGHTPVPGNQRRCGCGALGCLETLVSERGLLESFFQAVGRAQPVSARAEPGAWKRFVRHVAERGIEPWLAETLSATAQIIAGSLNVLGVREVVLTGLLTELPGCVERLAAEIQQGALWGRFGEVACQAAPHRRAAGLVGVGIDRLVLPIEDEKNLVLPSRT
jgi:predicted NBD/HSP70 family sugar kinase